MFSFPGIKQEDNILSLLKLIASKNPTNDVIAKVGFDGRRGSSKCQNVNPKLPFWTSDPICDADFVPDVANGYCYKLLPDLMSLDDGDEFCNSNYDAEVVGFDTKGEIHGLAKLIAKGKLINNLQTY